MKKKTNGTQNPLAAPNDEPIFSPKEISPVRFAQEMDFCDLSGPDAASPTTEANILYDLVRGHILDNNDSSLRDTFLDFFRTLCMIRKPWFERERPINRLAKFHTEFITPKRNYLTEKAWWEEVRKALDSQEQVLVAWAKGEICDKLRDEGKQEATSGDPGLPQDTNRAVVELSMDKATIVLQNRMNIIQQRVNSIEEAANQFQKQYFKGNDSNPHWPPKDRELLVAMLKDQFKYNDIQSASFLEYILDRIFQTKKSSIMDDHLLTTLLTETLTKHQEEKNPALCEGYATVMRGLLVLGANPLDWIISTRLSITGFNGTRTHVLMVQAAEIILSHMMSKSEGYGEIVTSLSAEINALISDLKKFAESLYSCEENGWRRFLDYFLTWDRGAIDERAAMFWSVIEWIYVILHNDMEENVVEARDVSKTKSNEPNQGYFIHPVLGDGDCGYTAFGITREQAFEFLNDNIPVLKNLLHTALEEASHKPEFHQFLLNQKLIAANVTFKTFEDQIMKRNYNDAILRGYLQYDVQQKKQDQGWAHPAILQALAEIRKIELYIWVLDKDRALVPHRKADHYDYSWYSPTGGTKQRLDLLFVNRNHFERLELLGFDKGKPPTAKDSAKIFRIHSLLQKATLQMNAAREHLKTFEDEDTYVKDGWSSFSDLLKSIDSMERGIVLLKPQFGVF